MGIVNDKPSYTTNFNVRCVCGCNVYAEEKGIKFCSNCGQVSEDHSCGNTSVYGSKLYKEEIVEE